MPDTVQPPDLDLPDIADILDRAALLIEHDGLEIGDWWRNGTRTYEPGMPCCTAGAIGVAAGYTTRREIERDVAGVADALAFSDDPEPSRHPAFAAMMDHLCAAFPEQVFDWSDRARPDQVVARIRQCAAELRAIADDHDLIERIRLDVAIEPKDRLLAMLRAWRLSVSA